MVVLVGVGRRRLGLPQGPGAGRLQRVVRAAATQSRLATVVSGVVVHVQLRNARREYVLTYSRGAHALMLDVGLNLSLLLAGAHDILAYLYACYALYS